MEIPIIKMAGTNPMRRSLAPRFFKKICKKVDSITTGNPRPQKNSARATPVAFLAKYLSF
jgi:hypothetical protein